MKVKKRFFSIIWPILFGILVSGCGGGGSSSTEPSSVSSIELAYSSAVTYGTGNRFSVNVVLKKKLSDNYGVSFLPKRFEMRGCVIDTVTYSPQVLNMPGNVDSQYVLEINGIYEGECTSQSFVLEGIGEIVLGDTKRSEYLSFDSQNTGGGSDPDPTPTPSAKYKFINVTSPAVVRTWGEEVRVSGVLVDENGIGVPDKIVLITTPKVGEFESASTVTAANGKAEFIYHATTGATNDINETTVTMLFKDENNQTTSADIVLQYSIESNDLHLTNITTPIAVTEADSVKTISAYVVDNTGVGVPNVKVSITAVTENRFGAIVSASSVLSNESGQVEFTYRAPANLENINGMETSVWLRLSDYDEAKEVKLRFSYTPQNAPKPILIPIQDELNVTQNGQSKQISFNVVEESSGNPYTKGAVKVILPQLIYDGYDIGYFSDYNVTVASNGRVTFNYVAPQDIKRLNDENITSLTFQFFHEDNPTDKKAIRFNYELESTYTPVTYDVHFRTNDDKYTINLKTSKFISATLQDDHGNLVPNGDIHRVVIRSLNKRIGTLVDSDGNMKDELVYRNDEAVSDLSIEVYTSTLSGLLPIQVVYDFTDKNGEYVSNFSRTVNLVVLSGPPTAVSISYAGVEQNATLAKYIEKFAVTVTDAYNNPVNTRPYISTGAIVEYAVDGSSATGERTETSPRLWHGRDDTHGTLENIGGEGAQFSVAGTVDTFKYINFNPNSDIQNDRLVVFGVGYVYETSGKWDIDEIIDFKTLLLKDDFNGSTRDDLFFAVGHNNRQDLCSASGKEYIGNMKADRYQLDENGHALLEFEYDYHLTGKDIMVWVNFEGYQSDNNKTTRVGEAIKHTLRGNGFVVQPDTVKLAAGTETTVVFDIRHKNAPEWYRNGHFGYAIKDGSSCGYRWLGSSNQFDARTCNNTVLVDDDNNASTPDVLLGNADGTGWVAFRLRAPLTEACTFGIDTIQVSSEFYRGTSYP